jgi:hypothetical protein
MTSPRPGLPPIARDARRVLVSVETVVRRFSRYHRYAVGADLRREAMAVARAVDRAWRDQGNQVQRVRELAIAIDDLKLTLQLGKEVEAFQSFAQFEALAELVTGLGRQCGGWLKLLHQKGQNARAPTRPAQRAQTLSSRSASGEASP